jgi:HK97 family phage major capsid protein
VVSAEVVRANPGGYMDVLRPQIAEAFALAFDAAVLHGTSTPFTAASGLAGTTKSVALGTKTAASGGIHGDLNSALRLLVNDSKRLTGFALDSKLEPDLLGSLDTAGRPLYIESPYDETAPASRGGRLIGRPATMGDSVGAYTAATGVAQVMGFAGDWNQVVWGQIGGITYDVSTEAAVTINGSLVSLWQNNLVAIRAETEFGVLINDLAAFCKLTRTNA